MADTEICLCITEVIYQILKANGNIQFILGYSIFLFVTKFSGDKRLFIFNLKSLATMNNL